MRRAPSVSCRPPSRALVRPLRPCTAPHVASAAAVRVAAPSSLILRHLATRAAPPPSGTRPAPPGRSAPPPRAAPPQPQGVYAGSDFARKPDANKPAAKPAASGPMVVELTTLNIEEYLMRSPVPIIVECYAEWSEGNKKLSPLLEKVVRESNGALRLGKLNVEAQQELAQQLKVEQLPTVYAFVQGKMVDGFVGLPQEKSLQAFFSKLLSEGGRNNAAPVLTHAAQALAEGNVAEARQLYQAVLQEPSYKSEGRALAGLARCALADKDVSGAAELVAVIRKSFADSMENDDVRQAVSAVDLAAGGSAVSGGIKELEETVKKNPTDLEAHLSLASALFASGAHSRAIEEGLSLLKKDKNWKEQAAKNLLLKIFEALGPNDPLTQRGRQRFMSIYFL